MVKQAEVKTVKVAVKEPEPKHDTKHDTKHHDEPKVEKKEKEELAAAAFPGKAAARILMELVRISQSQGWPYPVADVKAMNKYIGVAAVADEE